MKLPFQLNHRQLLDGMFAVCGVSPEKFKSVCSSVDKLDKSPWEEVRQELLTERMLTAETVERIRHYVLFKSAP